MTTTFNDAMEGIYSQFATYWSENAGPLIAGYGTKHSKYLVPLVEDLQYDTNPSNVSYWTRISTQMVRSPQTSFGKVASPQTRRYTSEGLVFVQLFAPMSDGQAGKRGRTLAEIAQNAFRGKKAANGNVIFNNVRITRLEPAEGAFRWNIIAEYQFDTIG